MFENLSEKFERALKVLKGQSRITESNISDTVKEIRRALLDADVHYKIAKSFTESVKQKAIGSNVLTALQPGQVMVKIVHDELVELMGGSGAREILLKGSPAVVLIAGLQGSGKTTFSAKLAHWLKQKRGRSPLLVAADVYRPAAIEQLAVLARQIDIPVYSEEKNTNPVQVAENGIRHARLHGYDTVIVDTAGRLAIDQAMMDEIATLKKKLQPSETLFVCDAMNGQDAVNTAREFNERLGFDGVVLTKLDGDTRGGAALSVKVTVNKPIKFVSSGEKIDALDLFYPERMADRILGMGDIVSLVEKVQERYDEEEARRLQQKINKNQFDFNDFLAQIRQVKKLGSIKDIASMIPGMGKALKEVDINEDAFKHIEAIIYAMTPEERARPEIINGSRRKRIAMGSGTTIQEVNKLIRQFEDLRKVMKIARNSASANQLAKMMRQAPGMRR